MVPIHKVCVVHNFYQQPGGEDVVFAAESSLLESRGLLVERFTAHNDHLESMGVVERGIRTIWNSAVRRSLRRVLVQSSAQLAHFHNTFPLVSPSGYAAAADAGVPVVQTLHNFRLICPNALLFRNGMPCEECVGRAVAWPGIVHACYRGDRLASTTVAAMTTIHRGLGTWGDRVKAYIAMTEFARERFIAGGLPAEKIFVKPNFVSVDPGFTPEPGSYALFVGRLSPEKGIAVLSRAWMRIGGHIPLRVAGDGPMAPMITGIPGIEWLGRQSKDQVMQLMRGARLLIFPSVVYEGFPLVLPEAFATGLPVVGSNRGAAASIIDHGLTGTLFSPGDPDALASAVEQLWSDERTLRQMRRAARAEYEAKYTAEINYQKLIEIYERALC